MSQSRCVVLTLSVLLGVLAASVVARSAGEGAIPERQVEPAEKGLPPGAIARLGSLRLRHEQEVLAIAISADSKLVASIAKYRDAIRVWDAATGKLLHEFKAPGIFARVLFAR